MKIIIFETSYPVKQFWSIKRLTLTFFLTFRLPPPSLTLLNFIFSTEECAAGFQLTKEGSCDPCMRGYYRPKGAPACIKCPRTKTTPSISAKSQDECSEGMSLCLEIFLSGLDFKNRKNGKETIM